MAVRRPIKGRRAMAFSAPSPGGREVKAIAGETDAGEPLHPDSVFAGEWRELVPADGSPRPPAAKAVALTAYRGKIYTFGGMGKHLRLQASLLSWGVGGEEFGLIIRFPRRASGCQPSEIVCL